MLRDTIMILTLANIVFIAVAFLKLMQEGSHIGEAIEEVYSMYKEAPLNTFMMFFLTGILLTAYNVIYAAISCLIIINTAFKITALMLVFWSLGSVINMIRYRMGGKSFFSTSSKVFILYSAVAINLIYLFYVLTYVVNLYTR